MIPAFAILFALTDSGPVPVLATDTLETCQHLLKFTLTDAKCVEGDDE